MWPKVYVLTVKEVWADGAEAFKPEVCAHGVAVGRADVWVDGAKVSQVEV